MFELRLRKHTLLEWFAFVLIVLETWGCVHVRHYFSPDFNRIQYEKCVKKHGGETWQWNGLPLTCKQLIYPSQHCDADGCVSNGKLIRP